MSSGDRSGEPVVCKHDSVPCDRVWLRGCVE
jgi:hypothetical protein